MIGVTPTGASFVLFFITRLSHVTASLELLIGAFVMIETLRSRFGHFTASHKLRFAVIVSPKECSVGETMLLLTVSRYPSAHTWDLRFAIDSSLLPCLFSFMHLLLI